MRQLYAHEKTKLSHATDLVDATRSNNFTAPEATGVTAAAGGSGFLVSPTDAAPEVRLSARYGPGNRSALRLAPRPYTSG